MSDANDFPRVPGDFPDYHPVRPALAGHLQSVLLKIDPPPQLDRKWSMEEIEIPCSDDSGDRLVANLYQRGSDCNCEHPGDGPMIVLLHGLGGQAGSDYMRSCAETLLERGFRVLLANSRGCGDSSALCRYIHHPGRVDDVSDLLSGLLDQKPDVEQEGVVLVGMSLGGNQLLKFLAGPAAEFPVKGGVTVSAAINLAETSEKLRQIQNEPYEFYLLRRMRDEVLRRTADLTDDERRCIQEAGSIYDFDNCFTAPRFGYDNADAFYEDNNAEPSLPRMEVPTAIIYACDDPFVPPDAYVRVRWADNPNLIPLIVPEGGHVGFHQSDDSSPWHHLCIQHLLEGRLTCDVTPGGRSEYQ